MRTYEEKLIVRKLMMVGAVLAAASCFAGKISVEGRGEYSVTPDTMVFSFSVEALDKDMAKSLAMFSEKNAAIIKSLQEAGVSTNKIEVSDIEMRPRFHREDKDGNELDSWDRHGKEVFDGYKHSAEFAIVEPIDRNRLNAIYTAIVDAKTCNDLNLWFKLKDEKPACAEARRRAVKKATELAKELSDDAGVRLDGIEEIRYHVRSEEMCEYSSLNVRCCSASFGDEKPILPTIVIKDLNYTDTVTMSWGIKE